MLRSSFIIALLLVGSLTQQTQYSDYSERLTQVMSSIESALTKAKPEWQHRTVEPIQGSKNVVITFWTSGDDIVKVSLIAYGSREKAATATG